MPSAKVPKAFSRAGIFMWKIIFQKLFVLKLNWAQVEVCKFISISRCPHHCVSLAGNRLGVKPKKAAFYFCNCCWHGFVLCWYDFTIVIVKKGVRRNFCVNLKPQEIYSILKIFKISSRTRRDLQSQKPLKTNSLNILILLKIFASFIIKT